MARESGKTGDSSEGIPQDPLQEGAFAPCEIGGSSAAKFRSHVRSDDQPYGPPSTATNATRTDLRAQLERFLALFEHVASQSGDDAPRSDDT